jgi:nuclear pore complex protein Nup43
MLCVSSPKTNAVLTSIETHPTRPELLITGSDDGRVCLWDRRRLDSPFRSEAKHQRAGTSFVS